MNNFAFYLVEKTCRILFWRVVAIIRGPWKGQFLFGCLFEQVWLGGIDHDRQEIQVIKVRLDRIKLINCIPKAV